MGTYPVIAARFAVGEASVKRWVHLARDQGNVAPRPRGGGTPSAIGAAELDQLVAKLGDANAGEITAAYNRRRRGRNRVHVSSVKRALHRNGFVVKKSASVHWSNSGRTSKKSAPLI
jgi:transposase